MHLLFSLQCQHDNEQRMRRLESYKTEEGKKKRVRRKMDRVEEQKQRYGKYLLFPTFWQRMYNFLLSYRLYRGPRIAIIMWCIPHKTIPQCEEDIKNQMGNWTGKYMSYYCTFWLILGHQICFVVWLVYITELWKPSGCISMSLLPEVIVSFEILLLFTERSM